MHTLPHTSFKTNHQGQALVEYAILLILLVTLFVGGTELGLTALASNKNTEAAKTGISEFAEVNQQRINILNAERQYLINLSSFDCRKISMAVDLNGDGDTIDLGEVAGNCVQDAINTNIYENYVNFMNDMYDPSSTIFLNEAQDILKKYIDPTCPFFNGPEDPAQQKNWNSSNNDIDPCEISQDELNQVAPSDKEEGQDKYKALLLLSHHKLSQLPLLTDIDNDGTDEYVLSQAKINIGITNAGLQPPSCNGNTYDEGFPNDIGFRRYLYAKYKDATNIDQTHQTGDVVYLFNPLPIDVTSCNGADNERDGRPRIRILIDGYTPTPAKLAASGKTFEQLFVPGLPKLNQAMYSNYENVCVDVNNAYVSCRATNVQRWLKPPGKICFNIVPDTVDACPDLEKHTNNANLVAAGNSHGPTGYYFFANASDSPPRSFEYTQTDADRYPSPTDGFVDFSPAIQVECSATPNKNSEDIFDASCNGNPSKIRIHTRYRRVFEGFLTFGLMELTQPNLLPYFYNPNQVGIAQNTVIGGYGSEVGPLGRNGNPTIKHFMDFRGCYEVDVETNQISACN